MTLLFRCLKGESDWIETLFVSTRTKHPFQSAVSMINCQYLTYEYNESQKLSHPRSTSIGRGGVNYKLGGVVFVFEVSHDHQYVLDCLSYRPNGCAGTHTKKTQACTPKCYRVTHPYACTETLLASLGILPWCTFLWMQTIKPIVSSKNSKVELSIGRSSHKKFKPWDFIQRTAEKKTFFALVSDCPQPSSYPTR